MEKQVAKKTDRLRIIAGIMLALYISYMLFRDLVLYRSFDFSITTISRYAGFILLIVALLIKKGNMLLAGLGFAAFAVEALLILLRFPISDSYSSMLFYLIGHSLAAIGCFASIPKHLHNLAKTLLLLAILPLAIFSICLIYFYTHSYSYLGDRFHVDPYVILFVATATWMFVCYLTAILALANSIYIAPTRVVRSDGSTALSNSGRFNLFLHIVLILVSATIWPIFWTYRTTRYTNQVKDLEKRIPIRKLLLCLFVPFYIIYWNYVTAKRIDMIAEENGVKTDAKIAVLCLVFSFLLNIAPPIIMQSRINKIAKSIR